MSKVVNSVNLAIVSVGRHDGDYIIKYYLLCVVGTIRPAKHSKLQASKHTLMLYECVIENNQYYEAFGQFVFNYFATFAVRVSILSADPNQET